MAVVKKKQILDVDHLNNTYQGIITTFVLNTMLHHVSMLWIIENHEKLKYDREIQNSDWLKGCTWYNTYICNKLHGKLFEGFIINAITSIYHIMCYIGAYKKEHQSSSCDDESICGGCPLPKNSMIEALESLGATVCFIGCWLKALEHNFLELCDFYTHYLEELFQNIPVELPNQPSPKEKGKSLLHAIRGGWYVEKLGQKLPPLKKRKLFKKWKKRKIE